MLSGIRKVGLTAVGLGVLTLPFFELGIVHELSDSIFSVIILIYLPALGSTIYSSYRGLNSWQEQFQAIGVPLGVLASVAILIYDLNSMSEGSSLFPGIAKSFFAIFNGGLVASVGYFLADGKESKLKHETKSLLDIFVLVSLCVLPVFASVWYLGLRVWVFVGPTAVILFYAPFFFLFAQSTNPSLEKLQKTIIAGMLGPVLVSMMFWLFYSQEDLKATGPAIALGLHGLFYGAFWLVLIGVLFKPSEALKGSQWRASWHILEIYALFVLIIYAPPSFIEVYGNLQ